MPEVSLPGYYNLQVFATDGTPAESHRLYTYAPSTTTHKLAYTDAAGTTSHTYTSDGIGGLYIGLNARGELPAPLWLAVGGYDLTLKTPAGSTVWTRRAEGAEEVPTANRPMGGFKHTGAANASASGEYVVWAQNATLGNITSTGNVTIAGTLGLTGNLTTDLVLASGKKVTASGTSVNAAVGLVGVGTITTNLAYGSAQTIGGGLLVVAGSDAGGASFCAVYAVSVKRSGGTGSVTSSLIVRTGASPDPFLTIGTTGGADGFVTVAVAATGANITNAFGFGF